MTTASGEKTLTTSSNGPLSSASEPSSMGHASDQRSLGGLFSDLAGQTGTLLRKEIDLARVEMVEKAKLAAKDSTIIAAGGIVLLAAFALLLAAGVLLLAKVVPLWASALIFAVVLAIVGGVAAAMGYRALKKVEPAPRQTIQTLKENRAWVKAELAR